MSCMPVARDDILKLRSYKPGAQIDDSVRLNANEAPLGRGESTLNRYPEVHPISLQERLAELFDVAAENLLVTRGSSEAIDVLIRAWCRAYRDAIVTTPPTFEMYRVYADIQGVERIDVALDADTFAANPDRITAACTPDTKLVFLCSPNNPTGTLIPEADILRIVEARKGKSIVVVDEAYIEFSDRESLARCVTRHENLVVLRTLSKAHALAGARCGVAIACEPIVDIMSKVLPPYSFPSPVIDSVIAALSRQQIENSASAVAEIVAERERLAPALKLQRCVVKTWPSKSNFILACFEDLAALSEHLMARKILIRDLGGHPGLRNCARITIGTRVENDLLLDALTDFGDQQ